MKLLLMLILFNLLITVQDISAQKGEVTFTVIDVYTHNSLEGANVILSGNSPNFDITNDEGKVIFIKEVGTKYDIVVTKTGYRPTRSEISIRDTGHITKILELASDVGTKELLAKLNKAYNGNGKKSTENDLRDLITRVEKIKEYLTEDEIENYNYIRDSYNNRK